MGRIKTAILILAAGTLAVAQPIKKNGECTGLTPRLNASSGENWGQFPVKPPTAQFAANTYQPPLTPQQSINCVETPPDLVPEIIAHEGITGCNPGMHYLMYFSFDERGRVWAVDARDYPNNINSNRLTGGQGRILILADSDGDGALDNCKEFYKGLVIPTSVEVVKGGVIASVPPFIYYFPNNNDVAGTPVTLFSGMGSTGNYDSHGQINSLTYSLDNWVYGHTGYNTGCTVDGQNCSQGRTWRFRHSQIGSNGAGTNGTFQTWTTGPANAHGIGQMENGNIFQSQATVGVRSSHSIRRGANAIGLVGGNTNYYPITSDIYLWEGSSSGPSRQSTTSGHDFYTARLLPAAYNNRTILCEGGAKLCHQDNIAVSNSGTSAGSFTVTMNTSSATGNIIASKDAWFAPLKVRTGPDGALWVLDWYNYLFLHNPASPSGAGGAWCQSNSCNTPGNLRTKTRSRIYRLLPAAGQAQPYLNLSSTTPEADLVGALSHSNFTWRLQAQKQLIYRATLSAQTLDLLEAILKTQATPDAMGNDPAATHAIWVLEGRGLLASDATRWSAVAQTAMKNPAWATRRNIVMAMPRTAAYGAVLHAACAVNDEHSQVRLQAMVTIQEGATATHHPMWTSFDIGHVTAARTAASITTNGTRACTPTTGDLAARSTVSIANGRAGDLPNHLRYSVNGNGIELDVNLQLPSGELVVYDIRGQVAFRSAFRNGQWSQASVRDLKLPVYFYTYRSVDGGVLKGQIPMTGNL
jgi:uncharacterized protein